MRTLLAVSLLGVACLLPTVTVSSSSARLTETVSSSGNSFTVQQIVAGSFTITGHTASSVSMSWGSVTDATGYQVLRCAGAGCTPVTTVASPSTSPYTDPTVSASTTYGYAIRTVFSGGAAVAGGTLYDTTPSACSVYTPSWLTGMEHGSFNFNTTPGRGTFRSKSGTWTVDSSVKRSGGYSLRIVDASSSLNGWAEPPFFSSPSSFVTARFAVRLETLPTTTTELISFWEAGASSRIASLEFNTNGLTQAKVDSTATLGTTTLSAATWYVIDVKVDYSTATNKIDWRVNGVVQPQATKAASIRPLTSAQFGSQLGTEVFTANYDDMVITTNPADYPLPNASILGISPNAMGTITNPNSYLKENTGSTNISSTSWGLLDERPMTATTDYVRQTTASAGNYANVGLTDVAAGGCIGGVSATVALHSAGTTANQAKTSIFEGATETVIHDDSVATTTLQYRTKVITPSSGLWTATKLTGLEARIGAAANTASAPYWDSLMLEVDQSTYDEEVLADNPEAYWRLGEASGTTTAADRTGNHPGSYTASAGLGATGWTTESDTAGTFTGSGIPLAVPRDNNFFAAAGEPFTFEFVHKRGTEAVGDFPAIISQGNFNASPGTGWGVYYSQATMKFSLKRNNVAASSLTSVNSAALTHWAVTYDGNLTVKWYMNGVLDNTVTLASAYPTMGVAAGNMQIGYSATYGTTESTVDEIAYYRTELSAARLQAHVDAR